MYNQFFISTWKQSYFFAISKGYLKNIIIQDNFWDCSFQILVDSCHDRFEIALFWTPRWNITTGNFPDLLCRFHFTMISIFCDLKININLFSSFKNEDLLFLLANQAQNKLLYVVYFLPNSQVYENDNLAEAWIRVCKPGIISRHQWSVFGMTFARK